jgi:hypothetical protein
MNDSPPLGPQEPTSVPDSSLRLKQEQQRTHGVEAPPIETLREQRVVEPRQPALRPPEISRHEADESTL